MNANSLSRYLLSILLMAPLAAAGQNVGLGIKGGTTGIGADLYGSINPSFNIRLSGSYFPYSYSETIDDDDVDIRYDAKAELLALSALVDWYPTRSSFHLTGGIYYNGTNASGEGVPIENYEYASRTFTPGELGSLSAEAEYESVVAPYLGLGFGNPFRTERTVGFFARLGVMYTDSPSFTMQGTGIIAPTANQGRDIEEGLQDFRWYPVLDLGLSFRFN